MYRLTSAMRGARGVAAASKTLLRAPLAPRSNNALAAATKRTAQQCCAPLSTQAAAPPTATPANRNSHIRLRPLIDLRYIRDNVEAVQANLESRGSGAFASAHRVKALYETSLAAEFQVAQMRKQRNDVTKKFGAAKDKETKDKLVAEAHELKGQLATAEAELDALKEQLESEASKIPNATSPQTPVGPEGSGRVLRLVGTPSIPSPCLDHVALCNKWDLLDLETGSLVSGSRFYYLKHELALLELALVQYAMHKLVRKGYTPILPPDLVRSQFVSACGFQPRDLTEISQVYTVANSDLSLVGTAEIPLASMYTNVDLPPTLATKPVKHVAFGHAFRTEAGGQGLAIRGLYRVHQFSKVEIFAITTPEASEALFDEIVSIQEEMYTELGLCFQVLEIPSEDLGAPAYRKIDMESWMPGRGLATATTSAAASTGSFGEISSTSNCTDFQARRLNIRCQDPDDKKKYRFAHTLNGTACAVPRLLISILEQHQQADGSVRIPTVLQPFLMGITSIPANDVFPNRTAAQTEQTKTKPAGKA